MNEYRCKFCHKLLFKYEENIDKFQVELFIKDSQFLKNAFILHIKCSKCNTINKTDIFELGGNAKEVLNVIEA